MIDGVATSVTAYVGRAGGGPLNAATPVNSFDEFEHVFAGSPAGADLTAAVRLFFLNGGHDAIIVRVADDGELAPAAPDGKGIYALDQVDIFNLLVLVPGSGTCDLLTRERAAAYCRDRRAIFIVDPDPAWEAAADVLVELATFLGTLDRANAALYFPCIVVDGVTASPSATLAGVIARADTAAGVWKAPAGHDATLTGVTALGVALDDAGSASLTERGVNSLRSFPGTGPLAWGARTLAGDDRLASDWKYLPVRRTALFVEESIARGIQWATFEPNGEPLWARLRLEAGDFLDRLFRAGAFAGRTPQQAFLVKCDGDTTTQNDIDNGVVNVVVGFAPLRPAEFVIVRIAQRAGQPP